MLEHTTLMKTHKKHQKVSFHQQNAITKSDNASNKFGIEMNFNASREWNSMIRRWILLFMSHFAITYHELLTLRPLIFCFEHKNKPKSHFVYIPLSYILVLLRGKTTNVLIAIKKERNFQEVNRNNAPKVEFLVHKVLLCRRVKKVEFIFSEFYQSFIIPLLIQDKLQNWSINICIEKKR